MYLHRPICATSAGMEDYYEKEDTCINPVSYTHLHLDHHVVGGLVDKRDQYILPIDYIGAVRILCGGSLGDFPDEVPGQYIRQKMCIRDSC